MNEIQLVRDRRVLAGRVADWKPDLFLSQPAVLLPDAVKGFTMDGPKGESTAEVLYGLLTGH